MCQTWSLVDVERALARQQVKGRELEIVEPVDRPAVAPVRLDVALDDRPSRSAARAAPRRSTARRALERLHGRFPALPPPAAPTAAYCSRSSSAALTDHGISSASRHSPVGPELSTGPAALGGSRNRASSSASGSRVGEEWPTGPGVDDALLAVLRRRTACGRVVARDRPRAPPASPCASPRTRPPHTVAAVVRERLLRVFEEPPSRARSRAATSSAGGRRASAGPPRTGSSPRAQRRRSLRGWSPCAASSSATIRLPVTSAMSSTSSRAFPLLLARSLGSATGS